MTPSRGAAPRRRRDQRSGRLAAPRTAAGAAQPARLQARLDGHLHRLLRAALLPAGDRLRSGHAGRGHAAGRRPQHPVRRVRGPALLATASMNGAIAESIFNVFFKLNFARPTTGSWPRRWGSARSRSARCSGRCSAAACTCIAFLIVMIGMGLVLSPCSSWCCPASILLGASFSAACLATTAYLRTVQDFDLPMGLVVMPMFLFSGTFFPISCLPAADPAAMELTPLFHGVRPAARA